MPATNPDDGRGQSGEPPSVPGRDQRGAAPPDGDTPEGRSDVELVPDGDGTLLGTELVALHPRDASDERVVDGSTGSR